MTGKSIFEFVRSHGVWVILLVGITVLSWINNRRSLSLLRKWAATNDFEILEYRQPWFGAGPFNYKRLSQSQIAYSVKVRDQRGNERLGWVRVGAWWWGALFSDKTDVIWV